ncbi:hypothetical protein NPIL_643381 [Nephila pilipes]|uniref:Uncharacterized protein n=1 Tax=Nephila pilipes TaxID=299642 RepID=A0A8X6M840_NEPPI|nr:hypothetical protein NPIL_643381 [Nephila pilipes]
MGYSIVSELLFAMEEYDTFTKSSPKIRDLLEKRFQVDLSRFNEDMIFYHYKCFKNVLNSIVTENKNPSTFEYESSCNVFKEIFKMTPLKKRPVRPQPTTSYESPASTEIASFIFNFLLKILTVHEAPIDYWKISLKSGGRDWAGRRKGLVFFVTEWHGLRPRDWFTVGSWTFLGWAAWAEHPQEVVGLMKGLEGTSGACRRKQLAGGCTPRGCRGTGWRKPWHRRLLGGHWQEKEAGSTEGGCAGLLTHRAGGAFGEACCTLEEAHAAVELGVSHLSMPAEMGFSGRTRVCREDFARMGWALRLTTGILRGLFHWGGVGMRTGSGAELSRRFALRLHTRHKNALCPLSQVIFELTHMT